MIKYTKKIILIWLLGIAIVNAQDSIELVPGWHHGVFLNVNASMMSNLSGQINYSNNALSEINFQNSPRFGFGGGIFVQYRWPEAPVMVQAEVGFQQYGGLLKYSDNQGDYQWWLKYNYLTFGYQFKFFLTKRLTIGAGPQLGFNLSDQNIKYTSQGFASTLTDKQIEKRLTEIFKSKNTTGIQSSVGYRLDERISMEARYYYGLTDDIGVDVNAYDNAIRDKDNRTQVISIGLFYAIPQEKMQ